MKSVRLWVIILAILLEYSLGQNLELRTELAFSTSFAATRLAPLGGSWNLGAHVEARYNLEPVVLNLVLDPQVRFATEPQGDWGLTEAYLRTRIETLDFSAGIERLPLETARLSVPYSLEAVNQFGQRQGLLGVRGSWNPQSARVRLALLEDPAGWFTALSLRQEFGGFELEGHLLAPKGRVVVGLGGSGTIEDLVVYGEVWGLSEPWETRYLLGLSGNLQDGLWTLEGGYASPTPGAPARHLLAGQVGWQQDQDSAWSLTATAFFDSDALREQAGLAYTLSSDLAEWMLALGGLFGLEPTFWTIRWSARIFL